MYIKMKAHIIETTRVLVPCIRAILMLTNIVFWFTSLSIVGLGVFMKSEFQWYLHISTHYTIAAPCVLIVIGTISLICTSMACFCMVKFQRGLLVIYAYFLLAMIFTLVCASIYIYGYRDQVIVGIEDDIRYSIANYKTMPLLHETNINLIDYIQQNLHCCGNKSPSDWPKRQIPKSCCNSQYHSFECELTQAKNVYDQGCNQFLRAKIDDTLTAIGTILCVSAIFPLLGAIFAFAVTSLTIQMNYEQI